jgi:hypothetical protein
MMGQDMAIRLVRVKPPDRIYPRHPRYLELELSGVIKLVVEAGLDIALVLVGIETAGIATPPDD